MPGDPTKTELDERYSSAESAMSWGDAVTLLDAAEVFWIITSRRDGRPHVTPLIAVWMNDAAYFCTGHDEQKARNLRANPSCSLLTGCNRLAGTDLAIEGQAVLVTDDATLEPLAEQFRTKYDDAWGFRVEAGRFVGTGGAADVYRLQPRVAYGFGKVPFHHTRWSWDTGST